MPQQAHMLPIPWLDDEKADLWVAGQTNTALRDQAAVDRAERLLHEAGLALHPDRPKNWDGLLALFHALAAASAGPGTRLAVLDAGAERYSAFLPALRRLGFSGLTGINLVFDGEERADGIVFRHGDITSTGLPPASCDYIACLSVIEHGVDVAAFLRESARLLRPGGRLFVSFDYWQEAIDTRGQYAYGVPVRVLTAADVATMLAEAREVGLALDGPADFACRERVVHWRRLDLRYTFANVLFRRN